MFQQNFNCLEKAKEYYELQSQKSYQRMLHTRRNKLAVEYMKEVEKYMHYEGGDIIRLERELFPEEESG